MDTKQIITPSGYICTLKLDLTFGQYEDIQAKMTENIQINPETGKPMSIDLKMLSEANKLALDFLLVSIVKDGTMYNGKIEDLPAKDGRAIMREIDSVMKEINADEGQTEEEIKKNTTTS